MLIIGIAGGTGSGKTTVVRKIAEPFFEEELSIVSQDSYCLDNGHLNIEERRAKNFDHPDSVEFDLLIDHNNKLQRGESIEEAVSSFISCTRLPETKTVAPCNVLIVEGISILTNSKLRDLLDIKIFVDCDSGLRLSRVIRRNIKERGREITQILGCYEKTVRPSHLQFIEPSKRFADIIIPQGGMNRIAINILTNHINHTLK